MDQQINMSLLRTLTGQQSKPAVSVGNHDAFNTPNVQRWDAHVDDASRRHGVDKNLINAVIQKESRGVNNRRSFAGAGGLMQLMPETARGLGVTNVNDPAQNIGGGTRYLRQLLNRYDGDVRKALSAYNGGMANVDTAVQRYGDAWWENMGKVKSTRPRVVNGITYNSPYEENKDYVDSVMSWLGGETLPTITKEERRNSLLKALGREAIQIAPDESSEPQGRQPIERTYHNPTSGLPDLDERFESYGDNDQRDRVLRNQLVRRMEDEEYRDFLERGRIISRQINRTDNHEAAYNALSVPEKVAVDNAEFDTGGGRAFVEGVFRSIPLSHLFVKETAAERQRSEEHSGAAMAGGFIGGIGTTLATMPVGGALVAKIPKVGASALGRASATRAGTSTALAVGRDVGSGRTWDEMAVNALQAGTTSLFTIVPEVVVRAGAMQLLAQPAADVFADMAWGAARGQDLRSPEFLISAALSAGSSTAFAVRDVASGDVFRATQARQRAEVKSAFRGWAHKRGGEGYEILPVKDTKAETPNEGIDLNFRVVDEQGNNRDWDNLPGDTPETQALREAHSRGNVAEQLSQAQRTVQAPIEYRNSQEEILKRLRPMAQSMGFGNDVDALISNWGRISSSAKRKGQSGIEANEKKWLQKEHEIWQMVAEDPDLFIDAGIARAADFKGSGENRFDFRDVIDAAQGWEKQRTQGAERTNENADIASTENIIRDASFKSLTDGIDGHVPAAESFGYTRDDIFIPLKQVSIDNLSKTNGRIRITNNGEEFIGRLDRQAGVYRFDGIEEAIPKGAKIWIDDNNVDIPARVRGAASYGRCSNISSGADYGKSPRNNEVQTKFDALPSPEVSSSDVRNIQRGQGYSRRVIDWLNQNDVLGDYRNNDKGWDITFNNKSVRSVLSHGAADGKTALLKHVPDLIEDGVYLTTTIKNNDGTYREATQKEIGTPNIQKSHIFVAKANIDGERSRIGFVVKEDENGKRYYDHAIKIGEQESSKVTNQRAPEAFPDPQSTISNIVQKYLAVNTKNESAREAPSNRVRNNDANIAGKSSGGTSESSKGDYADTAIKDADAPAKAADSDGLRPVELPEMVKTLNDLGINIKVFKNMKDGTRGRAVFNKDGKGVEVHIDASLPKDKVGAQVEKTLAHEIGHILSKHGGNSKFKALQTKIKNAVEKLASPEFKKAYNEAYALSKEWRPFDEAALSHDSKLLNAKDRRTARSHLKYRRKGEEVFADAISVLFNDPALLKQKAPTFWKLFNDYEDARNPFTQVYKEIQALYGKGEDAVDADRIARRQEGYRKAQEEDNAAAEVKKKQRQPWESDKKLGKIWGDAVTGLIDKFKPIEILQNKLRAAGVSVDRDAHWLVRSITRVGGQQEACAVNVAAMMKELSGGKSVSDNDIKILGDILFLNRVIHERGDMANTGGETPQSAARQLRHYERTMGTERYNQYQNAAKKYNEIRQEHIVPVLKESGLLTKELLDYITNNPHYSTFRVRRELVKKYGADSVRSVFGLKHQTGTFKDIANPLDSTLANDMFLLQIAARNEAIRETMKSFSRAEAQGVTGMQITEAKRNRRTDQYEFVNNNETRTVSFMDNGKQVAYNVNKKFADCLLYQPDANGPILNGLRTLGDVSRELFINKNPGFWIHNIQRDIWQTTKNLPVSVREFMPYYFKAWGEAADMVLGGKMSADLRAVMMDRMLLSGGPFKQRDTSGIHSTMQQILKQYGVAGSGDSYKVPTNVRELGSFIKKMSGDVDKIMEMQEKAMKLAAYKFLKNAEIPASYVKGVNQRYKHHYKETGVDKNGNRVYKVDDELMGHFVRTMAGTSDIAAGGLWTTPFNNIFLFANSKVQGVYSTFEAFRMNPSAYLKKMACRDFSMAAFKALAATGALSSILAQGGAPEWLVNWTEMYEEIPDYHLGGFETIPLYRNNNGKVVYTLFPKSYEGQSVGAFSFQTSKALISAATGDWDGVGTGASRAGKALLSNNPLVAESLLPLVQIGLGWLNYSTDNNPIDSWSKRPIISQKTRKQGRGAEIMRMFEWSLDKLNLDAYFGSWSEMMDEDSSALERTQGAPVFGRPLRRVLRVAQ